MSNKTTINNISFVSAINGTDTWGHGLPFTSFETLVAKAKANASVSKLVVFPAHLSAVGNGRYVPETKSAIYRGQRSAAGNWYATVNTYNVGTPKKEVAIPQEVATEEVNPMDFLTILGHFGSDAIARCHKTHAPFSWGKLYRHMFGTGWEEVTSKQMPFVMKNITEAPVVATLTEAQALALQVAEQLVEEIVAAKPRKTGQTYNGKVVWFSEEDQVYYTLSKKSDGKMGRDLVSIEELRERGKIAMGKK